MLLPIELSVTSLFSLRLYLFAVLLLQELLELHESGLTHQDSISSKPAPLKWIQNPGPQRALRSSADSAKQALLENAVKNPQTAQARQLIAAVYGVTNPSASMARTGLERDMLAAAAALQMGPCAQHGMLLNRYAHLSARPSFAAYNQH